MRGRVAAATLRRFGGLDRSLLVRGLDTAGQVGAAAAEVVRVRRDPAAVALRRKLAARRRVQSWAVAAAAGGGLEAWAQVQVWHGRWNLDSVVALVLGVLVLGWAVLGLLRSGVELRVRSRAVAALPPPQPSRPTVAAPVRPLMAVLSGHSDNLRAMTALIGVSDEPGVRGLRRDVLAAADGAERHLRGRAAAYSTVVRTARGAASAPAGLQRTAADLLRQLETGVAQYGRLVGSAAEAVDASRALAVHLQGAEAAAVATPAGTDLTEVDARLRGLAVGMRELADG